MGVGSFIFNFVGACTRWTWGQLRIRIFGGQKFTFKDYLNGPQNSDDEIIDGFGHGFVNTVIGFITIMIVLALLTKFVA